MDVINDDAKGSFRRIEVLTGPARRRRWSDDEKVRIVSETLQPYASVTEVARRWEICRIRPVKTVLSWDQAAAPFCCRCGFQFQGSNSWSLSAK